MSKKKNEHSSDKFIASAGAGVVAAVAKQPFDNQDYGGFTKTIEKALNPIKINDDIKLNRQIAQLARRVPMSVLSAAGTYGAYDVAKDILDKKNGKKKTFKDALPYLVPAAGALATLPLALSTNKFPKEIEKLNLTPFKKNVLAIKNRGLQTLIAAPVGLLTYDVVKGKRDDIKSHVAAGIASGALGTASTAYLTAKHEALLPSAEAKARAMGKTFENFSPIFKKTTKYGPTLGHMAGRTVEVLKNKLPAGIAGFGAGIIGYNLIKKYLNKDKK